MITGMRTMDMASRELPMSILHRQSLRPLAANAGISSMCSFATDLTARSFCPWRRESQSQWTGRAGTVIEIPTRTGLATRI